MVDELEEFWQHEMGLKRRTGTTGYEDIFDSSVKVTGFYDGGNKLVRSSTGDQVVASATVFLPISEAIIPEGSLLTAPAEMGGRESKVIQCIRHEIGSLDLPVHWEVMVE